MNFIPTNYNGHTFRSLMEARWAVFFDYFGFRWDYEPFGFETDDEKYLPDFYVRDFDLYVEIKHTDGEETERAKRFARDRKFNLVICDGNPHCNPLLLIIGKPDFPLAMDSTQILWYYKPGEGILFEAQSRSERPEYKEAVTKANNTRFGVMEVKQMLGQVRRKAASKLQDEIIELRNKYGIKQQEVEHLVKTICEFNDAACSRALQEAFKNKVDGLKLEPDDSFEYSKSLNKLHWNESKAGNNL